MLETYIKIVGVVNSLIMIAFIGVIFVQYIGGLIRENTKIIERLFRFQSVLVLVFHFFAFTVLMNTYSFSKEIVVIFAGSLGLLIIVNVFIDYVLVETVYPIWAITQMMWVIGLVMLSRLDVTLATKQLMISGVAFLLCFIITVVYKKIWLIKYLGIPLIILAFVMLLMTNATIGGATNWIQVGRFMFQPSEFVKVLYIIFLASILSTFNYEKIYVLMGIGIVASGLMFVLVFKNDLGSALIYYIMFILMCYVFTTNRNYILVGGFVTVIGGIFAYFKFSHVETRIVAWLDPFSDIDHKGYQITQSLFAIGNGGIFGSGLTLGMPEKIPVVTTDFIYSAIYEEMGMIVGIAIIWMLLLFLLFGMDMVKKTLIDFDFYLGCGILMLIAFQGFLIIGGVTRLVPLTGVTLPFVSYGGSSLTVSFIMLGLLQGIGTGGKHEKRTS